MFIYCLDSQLKEELLKQGFKLLNQYDDKAVFIFDNKINFNFNKIDKSKFILSNRLNF